MTTSPMTNETIDFEKEAIALFDLDSIILETYDKSGKLLPYHEGVVKEFVKFLRSFASRIRADERASGWGDTYWFNWSEKGDGIKLLHLKIGSKVLATLQVLATRQQGEGGWLTAKTIFGTTDTFHPDAFNEAKLWCEQTALSELSSLRNQQREGEGV